ncbi:hypothetical protein TCON_0638 [Astathelohania contejeani]|uniref:Uncharacterized protein n=1 Tax=Astathelohania contejeani TaxID=164912 RepID=A0ABQ7I164_9MICR|nr:hypothetical protein TCON_0638 [Thelohania contejeani]
MHILIFMITAIFCYYTNDEYSEDESITTEKEENYTTNRTFSEEKVRVHPENLSEILHREFEDLSKEMSTKITDAISHMVSHNPDRNNFKDVITIKKRTVRDGTHKVIDMKVSERKVPKSNSQLVERNEIDWDFGLRAMIGGILFLFAGLIFTYTLKVYQKWIQTNYLKIANEALEEKSGISIITPKK